MESFEPHANFVLQLVEAHKASCGAKGIFSCIDAITNATGLFKARCEQCANIASAITRCDRAVRNWVVMVNHVKRTRREHLPPRP